MDEALTELWDWFSTMIYDDYCDDAKGHHLHHGIISIEAIDNPGWRFRFSLANSVFEDFSMERILIERSDTDWYACWIEDNTFDSACGLQNLPDVMKVFKDWYIDACKAIDNN